MAVPEAGAAALRGPAAEPDVTLLAAHAVVLAALSGERDVVTGYAAAGGRVLPCPLTTEPAPWRSVVEEAARAEARAARHADVAVDDLRRELGVAGPSFTTVFDPAGDGDLVDGAVLRVGVVDEGGGPALRLRYRTEVLDADGRRPHRRLPPGRAGADRERPGRGSRRADPAVGRGDAVPARGVGGSAPGAARPAVPRAVRAAGAPRTRTRRGRVHAGRAWTYRELNARANRLGHALRARGLQREGVVAVATERNLDWMASVLAVFKAGGVYLPIEPHLPADRIAKTLPRARVRARADRDRAAPPRSTRRCTRCPGCRVLLVDDAYAEDHPDTDLGLAVGPDQLAYIYFTSGSTGEPKGAMCEHAGMLNHLQAKIARPGDRGGRGGRPDRAPVLRHLAVAADLGAAGRRADLARPAGRDPRRGALRRHDRRRPGQRAAARALLPRGGADVPGAASARACRTCTACRSPARR